MPPTRDLRNEQTFTQIYTPVTHSNGERLVQATNEDGEFCGWADGRGKFDILSTWEIDDQWSPEQAGELGRATANIKSYAGLAIVEQGVNRILKITI